MLIAPCRFTVMVMRSRIVIVFPIQVLQAMALREEQQELERFREEQTKLEQEEQANIDRQREALRQR